MCQPGGGSAAVQLDVELHCPRSMCRALWLLPSPGVLSMVSHVPPPNRQARSPQQEVGLHRHQRVPPSILPALLQPQRCNHSLRQLGGAVGGGHKPAVVGNCLPGAGGAGKVVERRHHMSHSGSCATSM